MGGIPRLMAVFQLLEGALVMGLIGVGGMGDGGGLGGGRGGLLSMGEGQCDRGARGGLRMSTGGRRK